MQDLIEFIRARLDEDAAIAAEAGRVSPTWQFIKSVEYDGDSPKQDIALDLERDTLFASYLPESDDPLVPGEAEHIARHDPARVLAEVAAKRAIIDEALDKADGGPEYYPPDDIVNNIREYAFRPVLQLLALPYADHPGYREEWRP